MKRSLKNILIFVLMTLFICGQTSAVFAFEAVYEPLRPDVKGRLTVTIKCINDNDAEVYVEGIPIEICQVADLGFDGRKAEYILTDDFKDVNVQFGSLTASASRKAADKLSKEKQKKGIEGVVDSTNLEGKSVFDNLDQGMYLVEQKESVQPEGIAVADSVKDTQMEPFIISVPEGQTGEWQYAVDAEPKIISFELESDPIPEFPEESANLENPSTPDNPSELQPPENSADLQPLENSADLQNSSVHEDGKESDKDKGIIKTIIDAVKTGDAAELDFWIALAGISMLAVICILLIENRKRKHEK